MWLMQCSNKFTAMVVSFMYIIQHVRDAGMKVIRHAGVDRMIILDNQARQQMIHHFQLSLQCNVSPIMGFIRHTAGYYVRDALPCQSV